MSGDEDAGKSICELRRKLKEAEAELAVLRKAKCRCPVCGVDFSQHAKAKAVMESLEPTSIEKVAGGPDNTCFDKRRKR